jgi:hypothetical protein
MKLTLLCFKAKSEKISIPSFESLNLEILLYINLTPTKLSQKILRLHKYFLFICFFLFLTTAEDFFYLEPGLLIILTLQYGKLQMYACREEVHKV